MSKTGTCPDCDRAVEDLKALKAVGVCDDCHKILLRTWARMDSAYRRLMGEE